MYKLLFLAVALAVTACGDAQGGETPPATDSTGLAIPPDLTERLIKENAEHYTFACVFSYDFTEDEDYYEGFARGLPVPTTAGWAIGTLGVPGLGDSAGYITIYDAVSDPTDVTVFERIGAENRICFIPKP